MRNTQRERQLKVGITGTRYGLSKEQSNALTLWLRANTPDSLAHGSCIGADADAHRCALQEGIPIIIYPPLDMGQAVHYNPMDKGITLLPPQGYLDRNKAIVDTTDILVVLPHQQTGEELRSGTWSTCRYARKQGKPVIIIRPNGGQE